jgi:hypothetical protein
MPKQRPRAVVELFPNRPKVWNWWEDTHSVLEVGTFLEERGELEPLPDRWRLLLERPWAYESEHAEYQRSLLTDPDDDGPWAA